MSSAIRSSTTPATSATLNLPSHSKRQRADGRDTLLLSNTSQKLPSAPSSRDQFFKNIYYYLHLISYLPFHEVARNLTVCKFWKRGQSPVPVLDSYHKARERLSAKEHKEDLIHAFNIPHVSWRITNEGWSNLFNRVQRFPHLKSLDLTGHEEGIDPLLNSFAVTEKVIHLNLARCSKVTTDSLARLGHKFPHLTELDIEKCENIEPSSIDAIALAFQDLRSLNLAGCQGINETAISSLTKRCSKITFLNLSQCQLHKTILQAVVQGFPQLTTLCLESCPEMDDELAQTLVIGCSRLTSLEAVRCDNLTNRGIHTLLTRLPRLQSLNLSWSFNKWKGLLPAFICPSLTSINLTGFPNSPIKAILKPCINLTDIKLRYCNLDEKLVKLVILLCRSLKTLDVFSLKDHRAPGLNCRHIISLRSEYPQLTILCAPHMEASIGEITEHR